MELRPSAVVADLRQQKRGVMLGFEVFDIIDSRRPYCIACPDKTICTLQMMMDDTPRTGHDNQSCICQIYFKIQVLKRKRSAVIKSRETALWYCLVDIDCCACNCCGSEDKIIKAWQKIIDNTHCFQCDLIIKVHHYIMDREERINAQEDLDDYLIGIPQF